LSATGLGFQIGKHKSEEEMMANSVGAHLMGGGHLARSRHGWRRKRARRSSRLEP
jgi:hypothetical protein